MLRLFLLGICCAFVPATSAMADSTTTCTRSPLGTFVNCTTSDDNSNKALSDGISSFSQALIERSRRKRQQQEVERRISTLPKPDLSTGNGFLATCSDQALNDSLNFGLCYGFLDGFMGREYLGALNGSSLSICLPDGSTKGQNMAVVRSFIDSNPADRHRPLSLLAFVALSRAFPCAAPSAAETAAPTEQSEPIEAEPKASQK